jgi:hypothetical protein
LSNSLPKKLCIPQRWTAAAEAATKNRLVSARLKQAAEKVAEDEKANLRR